MRFVSQCYERASFYCYETVDICAWRRTLRWCRGTTSGRTVFTGGWKRQNIQRHLYTTADGVAGDAAVSNQAIADVNETKWRAGHLWLATLTAQYRWRHVMVLWFWYCFLLTTNFWRQPHHRCNPSLGSKATKFIKKHTRGRENF